MRILLSNDDGIYAPGIQKLAVALRQFTTVQTVAPDRDRSGASSVNELDAPLRTQTQPNGDIAILSGTPTDCIYLGVNALLMLMRPSPDIIVSGINAGQNMGDGVIYSNTVAAAMEERHLGYPALAVSLAGSHYSASEVIRQTDPRSREMLWIVLQTDLFDERPGTDFEAVNQGYVSLTTLQVNLTANAVLPVLSDWLGDTEGLAPW